jgi:regulator of protease activity HflC (stomatin/prohibitin superfamily)
MFEAQGAVRITRQRTIAPTQLLNNQLGVRKAVTMIDLRDQKVFYSYEVRTNTNEKVQLEGTVFWQVTNVTKVLTETDDPEGDVWVKARSSLISVVSNMSLNEFMDDVQGVAYRSGTHLKADPAIAARGIVIKYLELTGIQYISARTNQQLNTIIAQNTKRMADMTIASANNDVKAAGLAADIVLEQKRSELIAVEARNTNARAAMVGTTEGGLLAMTVTAFIQGLEQWVPDMQTRIDFYKLYVAQQASLNSTKNLATGDASLFVPPKRFALRLDSNTVPSMNTANPDTLNAALEAADDDDAHA